MDSRKITWPLFLANMLEFYEFSIYALLAPIIAKIYAFSENSSHSLIIVFLIFAAGFLMRPLGGIFFGYLGDRYGRKKALFTGLIAMGFATTMMGCLPTYKQAGEAMTYLLLLFRLLQGLALGGGFAGSFAYLVEHAQKGQAGKYSCLNFIAANTGVLLASATVFLLTYLFVDLEGFAWRLPFLLSIVLVFLGIYFCARMPETPSFLNLQDAGKILKKPITVVFTEEWRRLVASALLIALPSMGSYIFFIYFPTYLYSYFNIPLKFALLSSMIALGINILILSFIGKISLKASKDKIVRRGIISFILLLPVMFVLSLTGNLFLIYIASGLAGLTIALSYGVIPALLAELFPVEIRYSALALSYNFANLLFGGLTPLVLTYLIISYNNLIIPLYYLLTAGVVSLVSFLFIDRVK